jgi:endonuclease III
MPKKLRTSRANSEKRAAQIITILDSTYPSAQCALKHENPLELLVATILSAQCTDERVNIVTRNLFRKYRRPGDYANTSQMELENDIRSTGFYRNKAKSIQGACRAIIERYGGNVPDTMEDLITLPGVARKTANVVLGVAFGKAEGIVVDTHVLRVSRRLDLTKETAAEKIERDLMEIVPRNKWISFSHQIILHGRQLCKARKPLCNVCPLETMCESPEKVPVLVKQAISTARRAKQ